MSFFKKDIIIELFQNEALQKTGHEAQTYKTFILPSSILRSYMM